jgi:hypothetical protein
MKRFVMGILAMALLLGTITVFAATATRTIEVAIGTYRTFLLGQEFTARTPGGVLVEPFSYNGEVYVPLSSILHAMGDSVRWDAEAGIVHFGAVVARVAGAYTWFDQMGHVNYESSGPGNQFSSWPLNGRATDGTVFERGHLFSLNNSNGAGGLRRGAIRNDDNSWSSFHSLEFPLNGHYRIFTGTIVCADTDGGIHFNHRDNNLHGVQFRFYGDGRLIYTSPPISEGTRPVEFTVDVSNVVNMRIFVDRPGVLGITAQGDSTFAGIVDARLKR